ncbi:hypothetical protein ONS95_004232 [Cadophora gregata]|uniref:uncharacterized protein n=3 Tax=Cadophora gregata TaxID=51156 RepID=UPI0026DA98A7|nr:uncharacterized protein ONS95_004232 [Cadophora gregata]KAK0105394.1 hypothetical protein ONS96_004785 [Cadophora gregata f. sp. sojae]KAK0105710.1 hypothetical protein ONS95_004232 [Cadophora gregata]
MTSGRVLGVIVTSVICLICIATRTTYRIVYRCKIHVSCHRRWHIDDIWMGMAFFPLLGRALCVSWSDSASRHPSSYETAMKLLLPARIFYALFLWCMKMCLLELYLRICKNLPMYRKIGLWIRAALYATFIMIVLLTLLECRPMKLMWNHDPAGAQCRRARLNLISMAVANIVTDLALIIFPLSFLRQAGLDFYKFLRLGILFTLGSLIIITTIVRLPLILRDDAQAIRSMWASIEIACAIVVANAPFFQAVIIDMQLGGSHNKSIAERRQSQLTNSSSRRRSNSSRVNSDRRVSLWHIEERMDSESANREILGSAGTSGSGHEFLTVPQGYFEYQRRPAEEIEIGPPFTGLDVKKCCL